MNATTDAVDLAKNVFELAVAGPDWKISVLRAATLAQRCGKPLDPLRQWGLAVQRRSNHNKATCAVVNKLARIFYATLRDQEPYEKTRLSNKAQRQSFPMPA